MTVGILALDGADYRLADVTDLFRHLSPGVRTTELVNDLPGDSALHTPRVWTSIFAGDDDHPVRGWVKAAEVEDATTHLDAWKAKTSDLDFLWDRFPGAVVQDVNVCPGGYTSAESAMPAEWEPNYSRDETFGTLKARAEDQVEFWNADLRDAPQVLLAWWPFFDAWGHGAVRREDDDLRPAYTWFRDNIIPELETPDAWVILSDHGMNVEAVDDDSTPHGTDAHSPHGLLASSTNIGIADAFDDRTLREFVPEWQQHLRDYFAVRNLKGLGYLQ